MTGFMAFIQAVNNVAPLIMGLVNLWKEAKLKGWINDGRALTAKIKEAKTDEERKALALALFDHRAR